MLEAVGDVVDQHAAADDAAVGHCWGISGTFVHIMRWQRRIRETLPWIPFTFVASGPWKSSIDRPP